MTVSKKTFGLKNENSCISSRKNKDQYLIYQNQYREEYGVFPELDMINRPFSALFDDSYLVYTALKARGFYGALFWHDYHGYFNKKAKKLYHTYKKEWSFLCSIGYTYRTLLDEIPQMEPQEHIVDGLGYRKDEKGNYFEGTWENEDLAYGLIYFAKQKALAVGSIKDGIVKELHGACFINETDQKKTGSTSIGVGIFKLGEDEVGVYRSTALLIDTDIKKGIAQSVSAEVGDYDGGYENGRFYYKEFDGLLSSDDVKIGRVLYKDGGVKKSGVGVLGYLLHMLMALYMLPYYFLKFTYGLLIWPIYRSIQKKNWR